MERDQVLDSIVCVTLDIRLFSGRRQLTLKDLAQIDPSALPPADLATLGHKKICNPKELAEFMRLKRQAIRLLLESGFRFLGGYGLPEDKVAEVKSGLEQLEREFKALKSHFISGYEYSVSKWVDQHPDWASIIEQAVPSVESVASRLHFGFRVFRVAPASVEVDDDTDDLMEGSYQAILNEVAVEASALWKNSVTGRSEVTQKLLRPVRSMREKLNGLAFVDGRISPVVDLIDSALDACPKTGKFSDGPLREITALVLLLSDTDKMVEHGETALGISQGTGAAPDAAEPEADETEVVDIADAVDVAEDESEVEDEPIEVETPRRVASASGLFF